MATPEMTHGATGDKAELKSFGKPDDVRTFPKGRVELVNIGGATIGRAVFEPGWRWATSVQPIAKTKKLRGAAFPISRFRSSPGKNGRRHGARLQARRRVATAFRP